NAHIVHTPTQGHAGSRRSDGTVVRLAKAKLHRLAGERIQAVAARNIPMALANESLAPRERIASRGGDGSTIIFPGAEQRAGIDPCGAVVDGVLENTAIKISGRIELKIEGVFKMQKRTGRKGNTRAHRDDRVGY